MTDDRVIFEQINFALNEIRKFLYSFLVVYGIGCVLFIYLKSLYGYCMFANLIIIILFQGAIQQINNLISILTIFEK